MSQGAEASVSLHHHDPEGTRFGMWLFLYSEMLLFGAMFVAYAWYSSQYRPVFLEGSTNLSQILGLVNTIILLTSSLTVALSIAAIQKGNKRLSMGLLVSSILFALGFLAIKFVEWRSKFHHGIYPGSPDLAQADQGTNVFYALYYAMTGMHGLHVIVGMVILTIMLVQLARNRICREKNLALEISGLYWHLVDVIWIFLFPLFYLIH